MRDFIPQKKARTVKIRVCIREQLQLIRSDRLVITSLTRKRLPTQVKLFGQRQENEGKRMNLTHSLAFILLPIKQTCGCWCRTSNRFDSKFLFFVLFVFLASKLYFFAHEITVSCYFSNLAKSSKNSGYVFSTHLGFSITTPGMRKPARARLIAIR